jgi:uridine kinase
MMNNNDIYFVQPRNTIEVHLTDCVLSGPRGTPVGNFLDKIFVEGTPPIVGAIVNNELKELTHPIQIDSYVTPITMADADGARIYRRSLTFLLEVVFSELFTGYDLTIDHSVASGGYYCWISGREPLSQAELENLEKKMLEWVNLDLPFIRKEVPLSEAIAYFQSIKAEDKIKLLTFRQKPYLTLYTLNDQSDYHHGYMVPSTGYLKWFGLVLTNGGFTLRYPRRNSPTQINPLPEYPKLLATFRQYGDWLNNLGLSSVGTLNQSITDGRIQEVILVSEALHDKHINEIATQIAENIHKSRVVLIAGPSSSGKTTMTKRLSIALLARGINPFALEMDNYFVNRDQTPLDENGERNYESVNALNTAGMADDLRRLIKGELIQLPHFNFVTGYCEPGEEIQLRPDHVLLLEGIHGLNPSLLPDIPPQQVFRIYVSALTQLNLDHQNRVSTTDTRLIRRIARDARDRGNNARTTLIRWESVRRGEKQNIFPYQENADVMFNSALVYELSALKPLVEPLLRQISFGTPEQIEAKRLLALLEWFLPLDSNLVPDDSILGEFLGNSNLKSFKLWDREDQTPN